jgi:hypothetical protein
MQFFSLVDFLYSPLVLMFIIILARVRKAARIKEFPEYKYYTKGLYVKLLGGISLCLIYTLYYGGGDTVGYFEDAMCMIRLLSFNPAAFVDIMLHGVNEQNYHFFNSDTWWPMYYKDPQTFMVVRIATVFVFLSAGSFLTTTILFAWVSYAGTWRLYKVFISEFPELKKQMAIAILFIPSVFFWGSGLLKDTITLSAIGFYTYGFYMVFIKRKNTFSNLIALSIAMWVILSIKPYIFMALLPGSLIWMVRKRMERMGGAFLRALIGPFLLAIAVIMGYVMLDSMKNVLGGYSIDNVLEKAVVTNQDLKADYYEGNSFDIGDFDPTIPSMLSKAPAAITAAIFRPFITEARNIVMILSGLESLLLIYITLRVLIKLRFIGVFIYAGKNHLLTFALIFSLFFAFSVGISTSNFGSLVRYRIPVLPFFLSSLFIMEYYFKKSRAPETLPELVPSTFTGETPAST